MYNFLYLQNMNDDDDNDMTDERGGRTDIGRRDEDTPEIGDLGGRAGDEAPTGSNNPGRDMYEGGMDERDMDMDDEDLLGS